MNNEVSAPALEVLQVRTDMKAGTSWTYVPGLTKNNKIYACPAACPAGWTGATRNIDRNGGECESN